MEVSAEEHEEVLHHAMGLIKYGNNRSREAYTPLKHNGISNIIGIFVLIKSEIEDLRYNVINKVFLLNRGQCNMICFLSAYNIVSYEREGIPPKVIDWLTVSQ